MKVTAAINLLADIALAQGRVSAIIVQSQKEGRDTLSDEEVKTIEGFRDEAFLELDDAIERAEERERKEAGTSEEK